jgi:hypothetical protein
MTPRGRSSARCFDSPNKERWRMSDRYQKSDVRLDERLTADQHGKLADALKHLHRASPVIVEPGDPGLLSDEVQLGIRSIVWTVVLALCFGSIASTAFALTNGKVDTFSSGSTEGWVSPATNPPIVVTTGGPAGAGDGYVFVTATNGSLNSQLAALNVTQWAGDYLQAGVSAFEMDLWNTEKNALVLRVQISRVSPLGQPTDVVVSKPIVLPPGRGWVPVVVSIALEDLRTLIGDARLALSGATEVQIVEGAVHSLQAEAQASPGASLGGLGLDNFRAVGIPSSSRPTSWARVKSVFR